MSTVPALIALGYCCIVASLGVAVAVPLLDPQLWPELAAIAFVSLPVLLYTLLEE